MCGHDETRGNGRCEVTDSVISWDTPVVSKRPWFALNEPYAEAVFAGFLGPTLNLEYYGSNKLGTFTR